MNPRRATAADEPTVLTVQQAAKLLQVSNNTLYNLISQGLVPHTRLGKLIRIPRWGLLQHIAAVSGAPLPGELALLPDQSVHGQHENAEEA